MLTLIQRLELKVSPQPVNMFDLIEFELTRVRRMAEPTGNRLLVYLLDIAIIEANGKFRATIDGLDSAGPNILKMDNIEPESGLKIL